MKRRRLLTLALVCALALPLVAQQRQPEGGPPASREVSARQGGTTPAGDYQISGVVLNAGNSQPLAGAYVTVTLSGGSFSRTVTTGDDGRFFFDRLRPGKYALEAERRGFAPQRYEQHEGRFSTAIVTGPDLDSSNLVFRIAPDASLSGRISDDRNEPVRNARVMLVHELMVDGQMGKRIVANTSTDDRGYYHFAHLSPGAYYLAVSARPWYAQGMFGGMGMRFPGRGAVGDGRPPVDPALDVVYPLTFYPDVTDASAAGAITLRSGDRASTDMTLRAVPALHVRISTSAGEPQRGPVERRRFVNATLVQTMFDSIEVPIQGGIRGMDGAVMTMGVPPGHYLLRLNPNPIRRMNEEASDEQDAEPPTSRAREVDLVADTELDAAEMPPAAMISGSVKLANGQPPSRPPMIELRRGAMRRIFSARANQKGEFSFPQGFAPGSYEVWMSSGDGLYIQSVAAEGAKVAGRTLHIGGSDSVRLTVVADAGAGKIEGLALRDGKPQSGAMIVLIPQDAANNLPLVRRDQSDSDGTFTLATVLPGRYTLLALEKGWDLPWGDATVLQPFLAGGETVTIESKGTYKVRVNVQ